MRYYNAYQPAPPPSPPPHNAHLDTPPESYDLNFLGGDVYPLQTDKVALIPFIPNLHADAYYAQIKGNQDLMKHMPYHPRLENGLSETCAAIENAIRSPSGTILYAIFDLTKPPASKSTTQPSNLPPSHPPLSSLAGVIGLLNVNRENLVGEIGHIVILPQYQRTHISSHSIALLMHYSLDIHTMQVWSAKENKFITPPHGVAEKPLGLRRLQWQAHYHNIPSQKSAERLGFQYEGIARCQRVLAHNQTHGEVGRDGDGGLGVSRNSWVGAITWKDWEGGLKEKIDGFVAR